MKTKLFAFFLGLLVIAFFNSAQAKAELTKLVKKIQPSVVTVIAYDMEDNVANLGTGFFVNKFGHLITNYHVLIGKFGAEVKTADGNSYHIKSIVDENREADLIRVLVDIPKEKVQWIEVSGELPPVGQRVLVVGSPMGLEQTVSDGIVSSLREIPGAGVFYQMSAPISPGSSGSPVVNMEGKVIGVATFQFLYGQNLNFAVSGKSILDLKSKKTSQSLSEWTYTKSTQKGKLAAELCRKGFSFSINGQDQKALQYFKQATEKDPNSTAAWYGLGYCYAGIDRQGHAIQAYKQAIQTDPKNEASHFFLGNYYNKLGRYEEAIEAYKRVILINPDFEAAHFNLGIIYTKTGKLDTGKEAFEHVIRINPDAAPAYYYVAITFTKLGRYLEAIKSYRQAISINPNFFQAYYNLGVIYGELGNYEEEMEVYKQVIRINPDFAAAHYGIGQVYVKQGDKAAALDQYKILQKLDKDMADKLFNQIYQ
jgi:tetratricopeptide (TPR) repeat protein